MTTIRLMQLDVQPWSDAADFQGYSKYRRDLFIAEQAVAFALEEAANRLKKLAEGSRHAPTRNAILLCEDSIRSAIPTKGEGHE